MEGNGNNRHPEHRENPNPSEEEEDEAAPRRTPFANLSQVDADLALARTLQEQERAYMMLSMRAGGGGGGGSYFYDDDDEEEEDEDGFRDPETQNDEVERSNNTNTNTNNNDNDSNSNNNDGGGDRNVNNSEEDEENDEVDAFDAHVHVDNEEEEEEENLGVEFDPAVFTSDEAYAWALQDAEEMEITARLFALAGIHDLVGEARVRVDGGDNSQDRDEIDPDELSYEELLALGEVVGTESRGLSADAIASLPSIKYKAGSNQNGRNDSCVICRLDYEDDETLTLLSCKHSYHPECLNNWLKINKVCPVCSKEVSSSGHS